MARTQLEAARARLGYMLVRAPASGILITRDVDPGDVVQPGKVLMVLAPARGTEIVLQIDERNLGRVRLGQRALASADAYPERRFPAQLSFISPGVDAQRGTVEVKLRVPQPPEYLKEDMTVSVDIEIERRAGVLTLPADAVHDATSAAPWVLAVDNGRTVRRPRQARPARRARGRGARRAGRGRAGGAGGKRPHRRRPRGARPRA